MKVSLFLGIDFTSSNGFKVDRKCLHYIQDPDTLNPYQKVIKEVTEILLEYDTDKKVPVYGFGAIPKFPQNSFEKTSMCFSCTGVEGEGNDEATGTDGVMEVYSNAVNKVIFSLIRKGRNCKCMNNI